MILGQDIHNQIFLICFHHFNKELYIAVKIHVKTIKNLQTPTTFIKTLLKNHKALKT